MKTRTTKTIFLRAGMALAVMIAVYTPASSWAAEPAEAKEMRMESKMMDQCEEMKDMNGKSDEAHAEHHEKSE